MVQAHQSMTNRTLSGLFWMSLATGAHVFTLLLVLVVLARLLTPADFGLAAAALMVIGFLAIFAELGIGPALVQRQNLQTNHVRSGFTLAFGLGILFFGVSWLAAPFIAELFGLEELTPILRVLALVFPVQALGVVAESLLQRELRFRCVAGVDAVSAVLGYGGVGITLGYLGSIGLGGAWALVGAHLAQTCLRTVLLLIYRPHPALPLLDHRACAELLSFGGGFSAGRFSNYLAGQGENFIIGGWLGAAALGVYGRAYQLMAGPAVLLGNVLDRVLFPAMAQVQDQPKRLADAYRRGSALIALIILPLSAFVVVLAPELIDVLLGPEWAAVTLPLQILAVGMLLRTSTKISDALVRATGAVHRRTWRQTVYAILVIAGTWIGHFWGVEGVALGVLATLAVNFLLMAHLSLCLAEMSWQSFLLTHIPGLALAALIGVPAWSAAELGRTWELSPLTILALSTAAMMPCLLLVVGLPGVFLGSDGIWMVRKLEALLIGQRQDTANVDPQAPIRLSPDHPLELLSRELADAGVRYAIWKLRLDLSRVLSGKGDLDLLVDQHDFEQFQRVIENLDFQRTVNCFEPDGTGDYHYYGLDPATGVLLHVHASLFLVPEGSSLGSLMPTLEELVLSNSARRAGPDALAEMPIVHPQIALIVTVLQAMEKLQLARPLSVLRFNWDRTTFRAKLQAMRNEASDEVWKAALARWVPSVSVAAFAEFVAALTQPASMPRLIWLASRLRREMSASSTMKQEAVSSTAGARQANWALHLVGLARVALWRLCGGRSGVKQLPSGGKVIAIIGPDASGKSTMVAETSRWLGQVFRVEMVHLGKPPATWLTWLPNLAIGLVRWRVPELKTYLKQAAEPDATSGRPGLFYRIRNVVLAWDRRALARRITRMAARGWIVVCDRYPTAVVGAPDSARLETPEDDAGLPWLHAWLARLENRLYRDIPNPDVVIRLNASLTLAIDRNRERLKPGKESDEFVERRHKEFFVPPFSEAPVIELDTSVSKAESVQMLHQLLWAWLNGRRNDLPHQGWVDAGRDPGTLAPESQVSNPIEEESVELQSH